MSNKFAIDTVDSPDIPVEETQPGNGQEPEGKANQTENETKEETPEESGQVSEQAEEKEKPEEPTEEKKTESPKKDEKKYSDQFTTLSAALKAAENLAVVLADDVDFKDMTLDQIKDWYDKNRPRVGKEGFKGSREKAKQLNKDIKTDEERLTQVEKRFEAFIEKHSEPEKPKELTPPVKPVFDYDAYSEMALEDFPAATRMRKQFDEALEKYWEDRLYYEAAVLGKGLAPKFDEINQVKEKLSKKEAELEAQKAVEEEERQIDQKWREAEKQVKEFIATQGDNDFDQYGKAMNELVKTNGPLYYAIATSEGQARALFQLYQDAKKEAAESEKNKHIAELEEEVAALRSGKTLDEINAAKGAARITQSNGGVTKKVQTKMTDQEKYEASMRGNSTTRNKFEIDY